MYSLEDQEQGEMSDFSYAPGWGLTGVFLIPHAPEVNGGEISDFSRGEWG